MGRVGRAGFAYFAAVFAVGFGLGVIWELVVRPRWGALAAVIAEAPAMLLACWAVARWVVRRFAMISVRERLGMGGVAFALLMAAELAGSVGLRGMTPAAWLAHFATPPGLLSLCLFLAFAAMPLIVRR